MMRRKLSTKRIALYLLLLISVFPAYYHIGGRMVCSVILVPLLFLLSLSFGTKRKINVKELGMFIIWLLIKSAIYVYHGEALRAISFSVLLISISIVVPAYVTAKEKFIRLLDLMLSVSIFLCLLGIVEGITNFNPFVLLDTEGDVVRNLARLGIIRIISFTAQSTHYAIYTSMMAIIAIYRLSFEENRNKRRRLIVALGLNIINLLFTLTRSTIVCFMACVLLIVLKLGIGKFFRIAIPALIIIIVISVFFESSFLGQFIYMMLALVSPSYADRLSTGALSEYANGIADRFNLYRWVYDSVKDHLVLGMGERTQFAYLHKIDMVHFSYYETKRSIEVYPLYLLYHFGIIGMITELLMYLKMTINTFKYSLFDKKTFEKRINFSFIMFVILVLNIINWFAVAQGEESTTIFILLFTWICYKNNFGENKIERTSNLA